MSKRRPWNGETLLEAARMAIEVHETQVRKDTGIPYIAHPMAVAALVLEAGGDMDAAAAALLHDTVEDGKGCRTALREKIRTRFGDEVLRLVEGCTKPEEKEGTGADKNGKAATIAEWMERKGPYLDQIRAADPAIRLVALADKLHNARAILADYRDPAIGEKLWDRFNGGREGTLRYYEELADIFRAAPPHRALFEEFERTVNALFREARHPA